MCKSILSSSKDWILCYIKTHIFTFNMCVMFPSDVQWGLSSFSHRSFSSSYCKTWQTPSTGCFSTTKNPDCCGSENRLVCSCGVSELGYHVTWVTWPMVCLHHMCLLYWRGVLAQWLERWPPDRENLRLNLLAAIPKHGWFCIISIVLVHSPVSGYMWINIYSSCSVAEYSPIGVWVNRSTGM